MGERKITTILLTMMLASIFSTSAYTLDFHHCTTMDKMERALSQADKVLLHIACGYSNLISQNYEDAIEDYQKASNLSLNLDNPGVDFLISFGTVIACDQLNLLQLAKLHIKNIKDLINKNSQQQENFQAFTHQNNYNISKNLEFFIHESTSEETKCLLTSFISEIFTSEITSSSFKQANLYALHSANPYEIEAGFSFWKKAEKLARRIARTWDKIYKIYKQVREIEDDLKSRFKKEEEK